MKNKSYTTANRLALSLLYFTSKKKGPLMRIFLSEQARREKLKKGPRRF